MFGFIKKIPWHKLKSENKLRNADELFSSGKIFDASNKELNNILKELSGGKIDPGTQQHKEMIRAITVLAAKNNKSENFIQTFFVILTLISLYLAKVQTDLANKQTYYTEISTRSDRIEQNSLIRRAAEHCKQNPDDPNSGLSFENGKPATCPEILKSSQIKNLE